MDLRANIVIDFETHPIKDRPHYPPVPVGAAIKRPGHDARYWAWGHDTGGNNCTVDDAAAELCSIFDNTTRSLPILCHNAKFDLAVACEYLGLDMPPWQDIHDTMFLAFLADPHARSLGLKELCADLLQWPAAERDAVADWVWEHRKRLVETYGGKVKRNKPGEWIWAAPGDVVGPYAIGDVERTAALFDHLYPLICDNGMSDAYDRERRCLPMFMENERVGIRADVAALERDVELYSRAFEITENWLRRSLLASGLNFDADRDVAAVLLERGIVPPENWTRTDSGELSMSKENLLPSMFSGPNGAAIAGALGYRNRLATCLNMFMKPWLEQGAQRGGFISTTWNQVRGADHGTRTGRPSTSNPNFLNISKDFEGRTDGYAHPEFLGVPKLPLVRKYMLPDEGHVWMHRDFDGQELRVFAHFEQGPLWEQYQANPKLDPHAYVGAEIARVAGFEFERTKVKVLNFQSLYGGGAPAAQLKLKCSLAEAKKFKAFHDQALPGRKVLVEEIKRMVRRGEPIRTWGGRLYFCEPPGPNGRSKDYKLINYAVQGSAADLTKQALVEWYEQASPWERLLVTVYDEINISAPPGGKEMQRLREIMEAPRLSVPMLSSGKIGPRWGELEKCA